MLPGRYRVIFTCKKYRLLSIGDKADAIAHARKITGCNFDEILKTTTLSSGEEEADSAIVSVRLRDERETRAAAVPDTFGFNTFPRSRQRDR